MLYFIKWLIIGFLLAAIGFGLYEGYRIRELKNLRVENPKTSSLMEMRKDESPDLQIRHSWVPLQSISTHLQRAVIAGEDRNFATHNGFDYNAIRRAWEEAQRQAEKEARVEGERDTNSWIPPLPSFRRGASTISQQLAKNLYLSTERSFFRKIREAYFTYFLERELTKRRILEIYLNVIEWGDGIFGAEAASQHYFKKNASSLTAGEAAFLAAIIPNPRTVFNPRLNPKRVARRQRIILRGMPMVRLPSRNERAAFGLAGRIVRPYSVHHRFVKFGIEL
jgi:monofunctional glycosyltransferase